MPAFWQGFDAVGKMDLYLKDSEQAEAINQQRKELSKEEQEIVSKRLAELGLLIGD